MSAIGSHDRMWAESAQKLLSAAGRNDVQIHDLPRTVEAEIAAAQVKLVQDSQRIIEQGGVWARPEVLWEQLYCVRVDFLIATAKIRTRYSQPPVVVTRSAQHMSAPASESSATPAGDPNVAPPSVNLIDTDRTQVA